jgi:predicted nuclease of predicted toxin-antitoxin system
MKLVADESIDFGIIKLLRENKIEVLSIAHVNKGISDIEVLNIANENKCLLITEDKDFGELTHRLKLKHYGILLIRLSNLKRSERLILASEMIQKHYKDLQNNFAVLTSTNFRIKRY